ncbi:MAG: cytochrome c oxidase subunit 2A [Acidimicrobiia bacterium]|nr:cytochrome c oxidase subunit 2A [Acidimicrobiia bacterium]
MADEQETEAGAEEFRPRGTVAILVMFVLAIIILWGSVYVILLSRGVTV